MLNNVTLYIFTDFWTSIVPPSSGSMKMEAPSSSGGSVSIYLLTWCNIPEDLNHLTGLSHNFIYHHKKLWVCASTYVKLVTFHLHSHRLSQVWFPSQREKTVLWSNCTINCRKHLFFCIYHCLGLCDPQAYLLTYTKSANTKYLKQSHVNQKIWR